MPRGKKELAEQIIPKLREVEVEVGRGKTVLEAVKKVGVTEQTYYRWKKMFGGLRIDQAKRLKDLEKESARLKRLLADAELDKAILREAASGNFRARRSGGERSSTSEVFLAVID
jgi:putative transposase